MNKSTAAGVTLIELLIAVVIVAILASVAYPSYNVSVAKSKRQAAKNVMLQVADRQEQFFLDNKQYAAALTGLGYPAATVALDNNGNVVAAADKTSSYTLRLLAATPTTYTIQAAPVNSQAKRDASCGSLTLLNTGVKEASGSGTNCW